MAGAHEDGAAPHSVILLFGRSLAVAPLLLASHHHEASASVADDARAASATVKFEP